MSEAALARNTNTDGTPTCTPKISMDFIVPGALSRNWRYRLPSLRRLRPHEIELSFRFVLRDDERKSGFAGLAEFQNPSGKDGVLELQPCERVTDRVGLQRSCLLNRGE